MVTIVHIATGSSYVDDTQEITDVASHSSPSGSSVATGESDTPQPLLDASTSASGFAVHANFWASVQPFSSGVADTNIQFPDWSFDDQHHANMTSFFGQGMPPTAADRHHGLSPTGLEGDGAFQTAGQRF